MNLIKPSSSLILPLKFNPSYIQTIKSDQNPATKHRVSVITCGLRKSGRKKPLSKSRVLNTEAIQAVHSLKLAKSDSSKLDGVFKNRVSRLIKSDLLDTLAELQRQNELHLALMVFGYMREEVWYKPDLPLYCDMIQIYGQNKLIDTAEELFGNLKREGLKPDTRAFNEMIGAYLVVGMIEKAVETYEAMKESDCVPDRLTFTILIRNLEKAGEAEIAKGLKKECALYMDDSDKFIKEVERTRAKRLIHLVQNSQIRVGLEEPIEDSNRDIAKVESNL